jgi:hypothetical protein
MLLPLLAAGCTSEIHRYMRFPDLTSPGPAPYQRAEYVRHDPYPLNDVGPEVIGGRPREYLQPVNEVDRARMNGSRPVTRQPMPIPALPGAPPVIMTPTTVPPPPIVTTAPVVTTPPVVTTSPPAAPIAPATPYQVQPRSPY